MGPTTWYFLSIEGQTYHVDVLVRCLLSWYELSWLESSWHESFESESHNFLAYHFQLQKNSQAQNFWKGFCVIPRRSPFGKIRYTRCRKKDVKHPPPGSSPAVASNGSRWVHLDVVINTLTDPPPLDSRTTIQNTKGDIMVTFPPSGNGSGRLVGVGGG